MKKLKLMSAVFTVFCGVMLIMGIHLFSAGLALAAAALVGFFVTWIRLPSSFKWFLTTWVRYVIDVVMTFGAPWLLRGTITGAVGALLLGVMISIFLEVERIRIRGGFRRGTTWSTQE